MCAKRYFFLNLIAYAIRYKMYKKLFTDGDTYITIGYMYDSTKYIDDYLPLRDPRTFRQCTFNEIIRHYIGASFTQLAFIRITTNELSEYLHDLGYLTGTIIGNNGGIATSHIDKATATNISIDIFDSTNPHRTWNCANRYDCGTNVELFKALTAMNNNTYYKQWITDGNEYVLCNTHELPEEYANFSKATKEQLIKLFS